MEEHRVTKATKDRIIHVRVYQGGFDVLETIATEEHITVSKLVRGILTEWIGKRQEREQSESADEDKGVYELQRRRGI